MHIGQSDITVSAARNIIGCNKILGVSTHNIKQARVAQQEGADYIGAGPLFPTATKAYEPPVGLAYLNQIQRDITIPFVAIGGVTLENLDETLAAGKAGRRLFCDYLRQQCHANNAVVQGKTRCLLVGLTAFPETVLYLLV